MPQNLLKIGKNCIPGIRSRVDEEKHERRNIYSGMMTFSVQNREEWKKL